MILRKPCLSAVGQTVWLRPAKGALRVVAKRNGSSVGSSSRPERKQMFPFIKIIHPDFCARETVEVKQANLVCIQNINELWDLIDKLQEKLERNSAAESIDISAPFRPIYKIACFVPSEKKDPGRKIHAGELGDKDGSDDDAVYGIKGESDLRRVEIDLIISPTLCQRQTVEKYLIFRSLSSIFAQQGKLLEMVGIPNPWPEHFVHGPTGGGSTVGRNSSVAASADADAKFFAEHKAKIDAALFERLLSRHSRQSESASSFSSLFVDSYRAKSHHTPHRSAGSSCGSRVSSTEAFMNEVDSYFTMGNVLLQDVSMEKELEVLKKLRQFLLDYGTLLNFRIDQWKNIIIVLKMHPTNNSSGKQRQTAATSKYSCIADDPRYVFTIPTNFKAHILLESFRVNLPSAKISL